MDRGRVLADGTPGQLGRLEDLFFELSGRGLEDADTKAEAETEAENMEVQPA